ncbi:MAG TPA: hypothetical protein VMB23_10475 [Spirochaetia bacterium]|nr:hypothetical protein [Spirochaetia bacterium]
MKIPLVTALLACIAVTLAGAQSWTDAQEAEVKGLFAEGGFYLTLQKVVRGQAAPASLKAWADKIGEPTLVGTTVRDTLAWLPGTNDAWVASLVAGAPPGPDRDWILDRRRNPSRVAPGKFHLSLYPVRMDLVRGVSLVLPNFDWSVSYQDPQQMTVQALEKGYSATLHLRWIDKASLDVFDTARLVQMYAGFEPKYIVKKPAGDAPAESDLVPLPAVEPRPLADHPGVLEQVQVGDPGAWQLYAGRTRWYDREGKVLVVMFSVHMERDQRLADRDRALAKIGLLLDTIRFAP